MSQTELQKLVEEIPLKYFRPPFRYEVRINNRMTMTEGRYFLNDHHTDTNGYFLDEKYRSDLVGMIKHELTHHHLHSAGLGYQHRSHNFRNLLARVGGSRYTPDIGLRCRQVKNYPYECEGCHPQHPRVRKVNTRKYCYGKYDSKLKLVRRGK